MKGRARIQSRTAFRVVLVLAIALVALVAATVGVNAATSTGAPPSMPGHPAVALAAPSSGPDAVAALGAHLPEVAKAYGWTTAQLNYRLGADKSLKVDKHGYLLYADPAPAAGALAAGAFADMASGAATAAALAPLTDTFKLHSLPGAAHIVYLDFLGEVMHGNAWTASQNGGADIVAPAFSIDGDPTTFTDAELTVVQQVWQRVAEDYAPFNVDVTTEYLGEAAITRSSSADNNYGMRVLISPISKYFGSYGGIAYVGVFDMVGDYYKPALVFPENLGPNGSRYIGEAASHEDGHSFGLSHDGLVGGSGYYSGQGSGVTGWAPIMGVGYYQNLTQWSKGEYTNANNKEDDIALIASNGAPLRTDDVGNTIATAIDLTGSGVVTAKGIAGTSSDVDVFRITSGAGTLTASATPADLGPNLDILLDLLDANGNPIATNNPVDLLTASISATVAQGTYYIVVRGTGKGDPLATGYSSYGSLGAYTISANVPASSGNAAPLAAFTATPTSGDIPLAVAFDGSASYDPDPTGSVASYAWAFGDGGTATGASATHTYTTAGTYTATLTVTDDLGATGSKSATITAMGPNAAPTAKITTNKTSGYAPLAVNFSGTGSSDSDGAIASYSWTFGDGGTSTAAAVAHTYSAVGTYTATLKVTDNLGATATTTVKITVTQDPAKILKVASITVTRVVSSPGYKTKAVVKIVNGNGVVVSGVVVTGKFTGPVTGTVSAKTNASGLASLQSARYTAATTATFTLTGVTKSGYVYQPGAGL
jgi:PKD repeat protein